MKIWISAILLLIAVGCITYSFYSYYLPPTEHQPYAIPQEHEDTLHIAFIGDSWAFMHRKHDYQISQILRDSLHRPVKVHSHGICGQTSKEFYENIFNDADLKQFLQERKYEYCIISLGINDTYKKMSTIYYKKSMEFIIRFFLANNIHPIMLEIPDYDIRKAFEKQSYSRKILRYISMYINDIPLDCRHLFRKILNNMILDEVKTSKVSIIRYLSWNRNGKKDMETLYLSDGIHLNEKGYMILDSCVARTCIKLYKDSHAYE